MRSIACVIGLAGIAAVPCAGSVQVTFDLLVKTGDLVPGTNIAYTGLSRADASNGNFAWRGDAPGAGGIYARVNGADTIVAQTGMANPAGGFFSDGSFSLALGKIDGADFAFRAAGGIYARFGGGPLQLIANTGTINPNTGSNYTAFQQPYISNGEISFSDNFIAPQANTTVYSGGVLNPSFNTTSPLPAPMNGSAFLIGQSVINNGTLGLQVFDSSSIQGILTNRGGTPNMVATGYQNMPGKAFNFGQFLDPTIDNDNIAFIAWGPSGTGPGGVGSYRAIYLDDGNTLTTIIDTGSPAPQGGIFTDIGRGPSLFGDTLLFSAGVDGSSALSGIYAHFAGETILIADTSMTFDGKTPSFFDLSQQSLYDHDRGTFLINFTDGSQANYTFHIIPTPGAVALLALGAIPASRRTRTKH